MILVAYATRHGSAREVAEAVAATLRAQGLDAELKNAAVIDRLQGYDAVVLGTAIYTGRVHKDARRFLRRNRTRLGHIPFAVFGIGPRSLAESEVAESRAQLEKPLGEFERISTTVFGGVVDPAKLAFPFNRMPASDARDWDAIETWANDVAALIAEHVPHTMRPCPVPS